jgi:hypothetical protein
MKILRYLIVEFAIILAYSKSALEATWLISCLVAGIIAFVTLALLPIVAIFWFLWFLLNTCLPRVLGV